MSKLLSIKQFAALALGQGQPPWHLGNLCALYNQQNISLKNSIAALSAAQAVVFVNAATYSEAVNYLPDPQWGTVETPDQNILSCWLWAAPGQPDLVSLTRILQPCGASISYLSPETLPTSSAPDEINAGRKIQPYNIIGITGTFGDLVSLNVKEVPAYPSTWTADDLAVAENAAFLLNGLSGELAFEASGGSVYDTEPARYNPYAQPLAALCPGVSSDTSSTGLLGILTLNQGVNTNQILISLCQMIRDTMVSVISNIYGPPLPEGIVAALASLNALTVWLTDLQALILTNLPDSIAMSFAAGSPPFSISEIMFQVPDSADITIGEFTVNADGTSNGGVLI